MTGNPYPIRLWKSSRQSVRNGAGRRSGHLNQPKHAGGELEQPGFVNVAVRIWSWLYLSLD